MIKIKIVNDGVRGADDGATVRAYPKDGGPGKDGVYLVSDSLGEVLIESEDAIEVTEKKPSVTERLKAKTGKSTAAAEKAEADRLAAEKAEADRLAADKAEADRLAAEKVAAEKAEADRLAADQAAKGEPKLSGLPPIPGKK